METPKVKHPTLLPIVSIIMILLIFLTGLFAPRVLNFPLVMTFVIVFMVLIGVCINGLPWGIFINERNKMTLSRFQLVIWAVIVLSAFLTIALGRVYAGVADPLAIALPTQLWALLGISTTSLVGSPLILSTKVPKTSTKGARRKVALFLVKEEKDASKLKILVDAEKKPSHDAKIAVEDLIEKEENANKTKVDEIVEKFGIVAFNLKPEEAKFSDMFTGDEQGNEGFIDMAKVQMFFFTLIIAFSYMVLLVNLIMTTQPSGLDGFPVLTDSVVALLGISSAGYLTNKTYDKTKPGT
jgi:hypothetical protein